MSPLLVRLHYLSATVVPSKSAYAVHVVKMCKAFADVIEEKYAESDVVLFANHDGRPEKDLYQYYGVDPVFRVVRSRCVPIPIVRPVYRTLYALKRSRRLPRADLLYGRDPVALLSLANMGCPIILECHHLPIWYPQFLAIQKLVNHPNCVGVVVISEQLRNDFSNRFDMAGLSKKLLVARDGANVPPIASKLPDNERITVGYAGSILPSRGMNLIVELAKRHRQFEFKVAGDCTKIGQLLGNVEQAPNLKFIGQLPHAEVQKFLQSCDILIAPYEDRVSIENGFVTTKWMSPMKIFEYMAVQRPIVSADLPAIREIVSEDGQIIFVKTGAIEEWSSALEVLAGDEALRKEIAKKAYNLFLKQYTWEGRARRILNFFVKNA